MLFNSRDLCSLRRVYGANQKKHRIFNKTLNNLRQNRVRLFSVFFFQFDVLFFILRNQKIKDVSEKRCVTTKLFEEFLKISILALVESSTEKIRVSTIFNVFLIHKNIEF